MDVRQKVQEIHLVAAALKETGRQINENLSALSVEDVVSLGVALRSVLAASEPTHEALKGRVRLAALAEILAEAGKLSGTHNFNAPDGSRCSVQIPEAALQVAKSADMAALIPVVGEGTFKTFFKETVIYTPREDFQERVKSETLSDSVRTALLSVVEMVEGTPRVSFKE